MIAISNKIRSQAAGKIVQEYSSLFRNRKKFCSHPSIFGRGNPPSMEQTRPQTIFSVLYHQQSKNNANSTIITGSSITSNTTFNEKNKNNYFQSNVSDFGSSNIQYHRNFSLTTKALEEKEQGYVESKDANTERLLNKTNSVLDPSSSSSPLHYLKDDNEFVKLMEEFHKAVATTPPEGNKTVLIDRMHLMWEQWLLTHIQASTVPKSNRPFEILLETYCNCKGPNPTTNPTKATEVLDRWYQILGGNLELGPILDHFNWLVCAHANDNSVLVNDTDNRQFAIELAKQNALKAWDIVKQLEAWGYTKQPNVETYSYLMTALSRVIRLYFSSLSSSLQNNEQTEDVEMHELCMELWNAICVVVPTVLDQVSTLPSASLGRITRATKEEKIYDDQAIIKNTYFLVRTVCDAIRCYYTIYDNNNNKGINNLGDSSTSYWDLELEEDKLYRHEDHEHQQQLQVHQDVWREWQKVLVSVLGNDALVTSIFEYKESQTRMKNGFSTSSSPQDDKNSLEEALNETFYALQKIISRVDHNSGLVERAEKVTHLLEQLESIRHNPSLMVSSRFPKAEHYKNAIDMWSSIASSMPSSASLAQTQCKVLLNRMEERHWKWVEESESDQISMHDRKSKTKIWNQLLFAIYRASVGVEMSNSPSSTRISDYTSSRILELWHLMNNRYHVPSDARTYHIVLKSLADSKHPESAHQAHTIWKKLVWTKKNRTRQNTPAAAYSDESDDHDDHDVVQPTGQHYASVITAWSRSSDPNAGDYALEVFKRLEEDYHNALVANSSSNKLEKQGRQSGGAAYLKPSAVHYNALITALGRATANKTFTNNRSRGTRPSSSSTHTHETPEPYAMVLEIFQKMKQNRDIESDVDIVAYGSIMDVLSRMRSPKAAEIAESLLDEIESKWLEHEAEEDSDRIGATNATIRKNKKRIQLRPNVHCYASCIFAWGRSGRKDAPEKAEAIYQRLLTAYYEKSNQHESLKPNEIIYNGLIDAWMKSERPEAGIRADEVISRMETYGTPPNSIIYTTAILAHAKSNSSLGNISGQHNSVNNHSLSGGAGTSDTSDNNDDLMKNELENYCCAERAEAIFEHMCKRYYEDGDISMKPAAYTATSVIQAYGRSHRSDKAERAYDILQMMNQAYQSGDLEMKPTLLTYTSVLNACAYTPTTAASSNVNTPSFTASKPETISEGKTMSNYNRKAVDIALKVMDELRALQDDSMKPNHITYNTLLRVLACQIPASVKLEDPTENFQVESYRMATIVFQQCCDDGQVHPIILKTLGTYWHGLYSKLPTKTRDVSDNTNEGNRKKKKKKKQLSLPPEWSRNLQRFPRK